MKCSFSALLALLLPLGAWLAQASAAPGQTILERLEQRIRSRSGQPPNPTRPGDRSPSPQRPTRATNEKPVVEPNERTSQRPTEPPAAPAGTAARADVGSGYLGLVADDKEDRGRGVRIVQVHPDGPAAKAGLQPKDLITSAGGVRVRQLTDMADVLGLFAPGDVVALDVLRGDQPQSVKVTLGHRPAAAGQSAPQPATGAGGQPKLVPVEPPQLSPPAAAPPAEPAPAGPPLTASPTVHHETAAPSPCEELAQRVKQLERRVVELEQALIEARKK